jgi:cell division protein FtsL
MRRCFMSRISRILTTLVLLAVVALIAYGVISESGKRRQLEMAREESLRATEQVQIATRQAQAAATATAQAPRVDILPLWYELGNFFMDEEREGWEVGELHLAFVILNDHAVHVAPIPVQEAIVETQEGKTYPASLFNLGEGYGWGAWDIYQQTNQLGLSSKLVLPPKLPLTSVTEYREFQKSEDDLRRGRTVSQVIRFRFAKAAHPNRVTLRSSGSEYVFELPDPSYGAPVPIPDLPARSVQDLSSTLSQLNPALTFGFDQCAISVTNTNKFDNEQAAISDRYPYYGVFLSWSGIYLVFESSEEKGPLSSFKVGPGQTKTIGLDFGQFGSPIYLVLYKDNLTEVEIYKLPEGCYSR